MNDYRNDQIKRQHEMANWSQEHIDYWNEGYEFHQTHWPDGEEATPLRDAMQFARFSIIDLSPDAEAYWAGYERSVMDKYERGELENQPAASEDDLKFAMGEVMRFINGDRK